MEYLDTGGRDPVKTLHTWLSSKLPGATYFGCQSGYFTADALYAFEGEVRAILDGGGEVRLVLGANEDELSAADLNDALDLLEPYGAQASIMLVSAVDVLMHPKTFYVERGGAERHAVVGSANLTGSGLGANIEACLAVSSATDPAAPFDEIKAAIEAWRVGAHPNAKVLDRVLVPKLAAAGAINKARRARVTPKKSLRKLFPPFGRIVAVPRRKRERWGPSVPPAARVQALPHILQPGVFPNNAVGLVKRLSDFDTKVFRGERGTAYVSMPPDLLQYLPTTPFGKHQEPRTDLELHVRHSSAPHRSFTSGNRPTNITGVGYGVTKVSNEDVRFNYLKVTVNGVRTIAAEENVAPPGGGDVLAVEFDLAARVARLTFVVEDPLKATLVGLCGNNTWAWLPAGVVPPW